MMGNYDFNKPMQIQKCTKIKQKQKEKEEKISTSDSREWKLATLTSQRLREHTSTQKTRLKQQENRKTLNSESTKPQSK